VPSQKSNALTRDVKNIFTIMGVRGPLLVEVCSALQMEVFHYILNIYIYTHTHTMFQH
jgi:hypothetical protein